MDEKDRERVHALAKKMKELHLAASTEEALERAREIVGSAQENGKPIKDLLNEIKEVADEQAKEAEHIEKSSEKSRKEFEAEVHEEKKQAEHSIESGEKTESSAKSAKEQVDFDIKTHKLEKGDLKEATKEVEDLHCAQKDAEFIVKEAEKVQKPKKK